ncbi:hypothetical protein MRB53_030161 [Persea americana]|uniref:Uncharacterized protein n=1 Tax=Persea americana TaxID=3435 RepID=A0ACC2KLI1_PERAE|nr:hypothetical protein MRB53_030161 [Persea americana]
MARKERYLYVQSMQWLLRLNLSDLCGESGSSSRPDFEVAHDYSDGKVPIGMGCMVVGSKIYMVGGENTKEGSMLLERDEKNWLNSDNVYAFDPTKSEDRLVLVRDGAVPSLNAPKTCPLVGFDPTLPIPSWKILPDYPTYKLLDDPAYTPTYPPTADDYFAWGHKFVSAPPDYFIFDAKDEEWTNGHWLLRQFADKSAPYPHGVAVEFEGILFAVSNDINAVVAYGLDAVGERPVVHRGTLHSYHLGSWHDLNPLIYSVFVCDHSNKSDIEADASSGSYSVQEVAKEHMINVPPQYLRPDQNPPVMEAPSLLPSIPKIDMERLVLQESSAAELVRHRF